MKETEQFSLPQKWGTLRPKFIVSLVAILASLGIAGGYIEISQSRKDIMEILRKEAETVSDALSVSAENAVYAYRETESLLERHLFNTAELLIKLERENVLDQKRFKEMLKVSDVARAFYVDSTGSLVGSAFRYGAGKNFDSQKVQDFIRPLFSENFDQLSGLVEDWEGKVHYAVAANASTESAWVLCADPKILLDFRKRAGLGKIIQDIGEHEEIAYIVLQDEEGIISATKNVSSMPRLAADPLLLNAISSKQPVSRLTTFDDQEVFEVIKPFSVQEEILGLIRVGVKMDVAHQAMTRTTQRAVAVVFGFIVIGVILFNFLVTNQNYRLLTDAYSKIKTYTGNILENMAEAVVAVNRNGRITLFNRAAEKLFAKSSEEAVGKSCGDIIGKQTSLLDQTLATGQAIRDKEVEYRLNGHKAIFSVTTTLLRNNAGEVDSAVAVLKDLTEKKAYEERLHRQEKLTAMGELASGVAHEIRNPLNAISIIAQRFAHEFTPTEKQDEYRELANSVVSATQRVSSIIQRFLEFARPPKLNLHMFELKQVAKKAVKLVESQAKEKGVVIRFEVDDEMELQIDGNQIEQVFLNLLQNAVHATPAGGQISMRLYQGNSEAVVEISDTGIGISQENLNRIFDLYFTTKEEGTGMGLSVSQRIVTEHGGRIDVSSEVGQGSTFKIFLPIQKE